MVVLGDSMKRGSRSFPPSARLELLLGRVRRRLGRHRRGTPSVRSFDSKPKGILHQPQGDGGSAERPLRVQGPESLTYLRTFICAYAKKWPSFVITKLFKMPK